MKLHLGCGTVYLDGFINIDAAPQYFADKCVPAYLEQNRTTLDKYYKRAFGTLPGYVVADVQHDLALTRLPFDAASVDQVVMYQVLEHFPAALAGIVLDHIAEALRPRGTLRLSVPDAKQTAKMLAEADSPDREDWALRLLHGTQRNIWSHHLCGYVPRTLRVLLAAHGFGEFQDLPSINFYPTIHIEATRL